MSKNKAESHYLYRKSTVLALTVLIGVICSILLVLDLFLPRHAHFDFEHSFGFYSLTGFVSYVLIVQAAKWLRKLVQRDRGYYDTD